MQLTINMRVQHQYDIEQKKFVDFLLKVGKEEEQVYNDIGEDIIRLPDDIIFDNENIDELISSIFYNINLNYKDKNYIRDRVILTTKNMDVEEINQKVLEQIPEEIYEFLSADSVEDKEAVDQSLYPIEFLNTLIPSGMPPHKLILKKEAPIMLLRNLSPSEGLCNGTRLIIKGFQKHIIDAEILTGINQGKRIFIPRIRLSPSDTDLPFQLVRRQFPIKLSFAITINKAQDQTITNI
jgi:ATP-dependent DNA helicase PIF1